MPFLSLASPNGSPPTIAPLTRVTSTYAVRPTNTTSTGPPISVANAFVGSPVAYVVTRPLRRSIPNTLPELPSVTRAARNLNPATSWLSQALAFAACGGSHRCDQTYSGDEQNDPTAIYTVWELATVQGSRQTWAAPPTLKSEEPVWAGSYLGMRRRLAPQTSSPVCGWSCFNPVWLVSGLGDGGHCEQHRKPTPAVGPLQAGAI